MRLSKVLAVCWTLNLCIGNFSSLVLSKITSSLGFIILSSNFNFFFSFPLCMYATRSNWCTWIVCSLMHDLLHFSEVMPRASIFGNGLHIGQVRMMQHTETEAHKAVEINASLSGKGISLPFLMKRLASWANVLWPQLLKCPSTDFDIWILILEGIERILQYHLHDSNWHRFLYGSCHEIVSRL